jgi:hypothetical protein
MLGSVTTWHHWRWCPKIDSQTPSGKILLELTRRMSVESDLKETGIVVFGSSPIEFSLLLDVQSGDVDITPDQFLEHLRNRVSEWDLSRGDPHIQVLPSTVFKPGKNYLLRACALQTNRIQVILPHPIDLIFGKLHRLDSKDYKSVNALVGACGRPTGQDLQDYMVENPDIFEDTFEQVKKLKNNIETLFSYLTNETIDIQERYITPSVAEKISAWDEGKERLNQAIIGPGKLHRP